MGGRQVDVSFAKKTLEVTKFDVARINVHKAVNLGDNARRASEVPREMMQDGIR
jgi:hypothetical protein